jgi:alpha-N-arabinofuranosidase
VLDKNFIFLRTPKEKWYSLIDKKGYLTLNVRPESCSGISNPSFIGHRQHHHTSSASTKLQFNPTSENEKAGLLIFMNETHHYFICKSVENNNAVIQLYKSLDDDKLNKEIEIIASAVIPENFRDSEVGLKINTMGKDFSFEYSFDNENWTVLKDNVDGTFIRSEIPRDFVGSVIALYTTSLGKQSNAVAHFNEFSYIGNDKIYNKEIK